MRGPRVLAIVQAGGAGGRMEVLTRERAKPALSFAGAYQLIDFPLSILTHSGISDVWLSVQFLGATLEEQVANGRPWDLDRTRGGLRLLMPEEGTGGLDEEGFARGNADQLFRLRDQVSAFDPDVLVVLSADHVYSYDVSELVEAHLEAGAEATLLTTRTPSGDDARDHAVVETADGNGGGRVTGFAYKPDEPATDVIATEVIAYDPRVLREVLEELHRELGADAEEGDTGLGDFGDHLVPRLLERGRVHAVPLEGYWRDVGQPHLYLRAHQELQAEGRGVLDVPGWPILSRQPQRSPARLLQGSEVVDSLVSPGCRVAGRVVRSTLGPGVEVHAGASVVDSVVMAGTVVHGGAHVARSIIDTRCEVGEGARVGSEQASLDDAEQLTLVGRDSRIAAGAVVAAGARLEPGTTA
ncbi:glucose-1-phosphate adenylyltransferase family protein [Nocardioides nanhaiensis]|uniref:Glucose-1-phosphate adenylyltransferase family protein n=1 Tax=Nocardioides nanhaiensis TaxID=1476871 RepID=A0ABP8VV03_9ACTN